MDYKYILYEKIGSICKITINRPKALNTISDKVYFEFDDAATRADEDDEVRVIVIAGTGEHFGAGHDIGT